MKISVALCTFNGQEYIQSQLNSIFNQTYLPDEIVICDDNSSDITLSLIHTIAQDSSIDVRVFKNATRLNVVKNFEKAISLCAGDIIFLCDQDDLWMPDKVEKMYSYFNENPTINVAFTNAYLINDSGSQFIDKRLFDVVNFTKLAQQYFLEGFGFELLNIGNRVTGATMAIRKEYVSHILPMSEMVGIVHDELIALTAIADRSIGFIDECLIKYRVHSTQKLGLGIWINLPPSSDIFKYRQINTLYRYLDVFSKDSKITERLNFIDKRRKIIKSFFGILLLVISAPDYKKFYSQYACTVMKNDISDFYKTSFDRLKRVIHD